MRVCVCKYLVMFDKNVNHERFYLGIRLLLGIGSMQELSLSLHR